MEFFKKDYFDAAIPYLTDIAIALVIIVVGYFLSRLISRTVAQILVRRGAHETVTTFLKKFLHYVLLAIVLIAAVSKLGIATSSLVALIGAAGLTVALSLSGLLQHFAAGLIVITVRPYDIGDYIETNHASGTVVVVGIFNTILKTPDNKRVIVPNNLLLSSAITNYTKTDKRRIELLFDIGYDDDMSAAKKVLSDLVENHDRVLKDPKPMVAVKELADSSVRILCRPWVEPDDYWPVYFELLEQGRIEIEKAGLTIPYSITEVQLKKIA